MKTPLTEGPKKTFQENVLDALLTHECELVEFHTTTGKIQLYTSGNPIGVFEGKLQAGSINCTVRLFNAEGTMRVKQSGAINPGDRVRPNIGGTASYVESAATPSAGTKVLGIKISPQSAGAAGDIIEIMPFVQDIGGTANVTVVPTTAVAVTVGAAITDNTTGTGSVLTAAAGVAVSTFAVPINLDALTTGATEVVTDYVPGYKFKLLKATFVPTVAGTGTSASQTLTLEINTTAVTGGVTNPTLANTATTGALVAGTAITAANTGAATASISVLCSAGGTVFSAGKGVLYLEIQNMDSADAVAELIAQHNALRADVIALRSELITSQVLT